ARLISLGVIDGDPLASSGSYAIAGEALRSAYASLISDDRRHSLQRTLADHWLGSQVPHSLLRHAGTVYEFSGNRPRALTAYSRAGLAARACGADRAAISSLRAAVRLAHESKADASDVALALASSLASIGRLLASLSVLRTIYVTHIPSPA